MYIRQVTQLTRVVSAIRANRRLAGDSLWGITAQLVGVGSGLTSFFCLGRRLGPAGYGLFIGLYSCVGLLTAFAYSGSFLTMIQRGKTSDGFDQEILGSCLAQVFCFDVVLSFVGVGVTHLIVRSISLEVVFVVFLCELTLSSVTEYSASCLQMLGHYATATRLRMMQNLTKIILLLVLYSHHLLSIRSLVFGYLITYPFVAMVAVTVVRRRAGVRFRIGRLRADLVRQGLAYSGGMAAFGAQNDADKVVLSASHLPVDTGLYSAAYKIVQMGLLPIGAIVDASHMRFVRTGPTGRNYFLRKSASHTLVTFGFGSVVAILIYFLSYLPQSFLGEQFKASSSILRWLAPLVPLRGLSAFPINGLMGLEKIAFRTWLIALSAAVSIGLYVALIPRHGWKGAAIGTLLSESFLVVAMWTGLIYQQRVANRSVQQSLAV